MKHIDINIRIEHKQIDELTNEDRQLVERALKATDNAYAEYSHFYVGAALRLDNGGIVIGANQERTAIFAAQANFPDQPITAIAIAACNDKGLLDNPVSPCGACRQVILGIEDRYKRPVRIMLYGKSGVYCISPMEDLLPLSFVDDSMK